MVNSLYLQIVDRKSATLGLPGPREIQVALDTDHENLCKFEDCKGYDYEQVGDNIRDLAEKVMAISLEFSPENTSNYSTPAFEIANHICI